jgi:hypothetical protein
MVQEPAIPVPARTSAAAAVIAIMPDKVDLL